MKLSRKPAWALEQPGAVAQETERDGASSSDASLPEPCPGNMHAEAGIFVHNFDLS